MAQQEAGDDPPAKRRKLNSTKEQVATTEEHHNSIYKGLGRPISPPLSRRRSPEPKVSFASSWSFPDDVLKQILPSQSARPASNIEQTLGQGRAGINGQRFVASPIQLTRIHGLDSGQNVDAVSLGELLSDPLIKECWNFNFLFDLEFVMQHFDRDVREMIKVKIVHGFWKRNDGNRIALLEAAEQYPNIELLSAYIPDPFGTHHSKMLILFRHDDTAQVIIHTANMIARDWTNMTQAVWASPRLPLLPQAPTSPPETTKVHPIGSGDRFQVDLFHYLDAYEKRLKPLTEQLKNYDFSSIRAAFIGCTPSRQKPSDASPSSVTSFGWLGLREILSCVPASNIINEAPPHVIIQISSIATLGPTPTWLSHFKSVLARYATSSTAVAEKLPTPITKASTFFAKREPNSAPKKPPIPKFNIIFPTAEEIRTSLDGYKSGNSIHWRLQSAQQQKQLEYMHPLLCHFKHPSPVSSNRISRQEAHRGSAAPHIKTYIRFSNEAHKTIDWAMVTSANLSKQAWGDVVNKKEEIWIQSWETGVVVWPALFDDGAEQVTMVPVFGKDLPGPEDVPDAKPEKKTEMEMETGTGTEEQAKANPKTAVGFRMPYDLPLRPYEADEKPWCATMGYQEPDRFGHAWAGYMH
ncbi:phospholipase D/nuclease [Decorospora gaudefroyi]|uniref:Phospholipase D/nuclease n=1 Tax=Decorospora gaudefroyi TaxID=184978 RepID=A0A6A5KCP8_9PLEO|nr:phospholipase D/nuclease [Decorospora gaudefroyi]